MASIPAGPLVNGKFVKAALNKGFDVVTYKTARSREYPCQEWPNVLSLDLEGDLSLEQAEKGALATHHYKAPLSATNSFGVPSLDPDSWQKDLQEVALYAKKGQVVIGSFQGTKKGDGDIQDFIQDFVTAARLVKEAGVKVMEVNLSCPNEGSSHLVCFDIERTKVIVHAIKNEIGNTPLILKIAYFPVEEELTKFIKIVGKIADGIAAINTISTRTIDANGNPAFGKGREKTGACGHPIQWAGLETIKRLKKLREELGLSYTIVGIGGVTQPKDYATYKNAGADAVMSATGAMWNPYLAQEIKKMLSG